MYIHLYVLCGRSIVVGDQTHKGHEKVQWPVEPQHSGLHIHSAIYTYIYYHL